MQFLKQFTTFVFLSTVLIGAAKANITYTYSGNSYDTFYGVTDSSINIGNRISASVTFAENSIQDGLVSPLSWKISDGINEISSKPNNFQTVSFSFLSGNLYKWQYYVYEFIGNSSIDNYALFSYYDGQGGYDQSVTNLGGQYKSGYELNHPGTWTLQSSPVPEPANYLLFMLGLSVLGFVFSRRA